jgi:hypothetical protein
MAAGLLVFLHLRWKNENYYDLVIVSGATPLAVGEKVPAQFSLTVSGLVKKRFHFSGSALSGFAGTRIRTREFTPAGEYLGAYAYLGIPVFHILEGIAPQKPADAACSSPLDMLVTLSSASGKTVRFSLNELLMADDRFPVTLAYHRKPISPTTEAVRQHYGLNRFTADLTGLKLICPREPDTARYLDNVVEISLSVLPAPDALLPRQEKGKRCASRSIACIQGSRVTEAHFRGVPVIRKDRWVRIGHGHGFEDVVRAEGYALASFLTTNFPEAGPDDFFLFVACDGYRCLFSGREIFRTDDGRSMMIATSVDGREPVGGLMLAPTADYFTDRSMWGLAFVVRL